MKIDPIRLYGPWTKGYALDKHSLSSVYLGENEYGHPVYDTTRSDLGELMYQLKYKGDKNISHNIINLISPFLDDFTHYNTVDVILAAPPSNTIRKFQPVYELCDAIGQYIKKPVIKDFLSKNSETQLKNLNLREKELAISGSIVRHKKFSNSVNVLVIDDLYQSGTTLKEITNVLRTDSNIKYIYVLTMTKTRRS